MTTTPWSDGSPSWTTETEARAGGPKTGGWTKFEGWTEPEDWTERAGWAVSEQWAPSDQYTPSDEYTPSDQWAGARERASTVRSAGRVDGARVPSYAEQGRPVDLPLGPGAKSDSFNSWLAAQARAAAGHRPPPPPPEPVIPGDFAQQYKIFRVSGWELLDRPDVQSRLERLAEQVETEEARTRPGRVRHTKTAMLNYWGDRFAASVEYILTVRTNQKDPIAKQSVSAQMLLRRKLGREEAELAKSVQGYDLVKQVTELRERYRQQWAQRVDLAARRFVDLAENEAQLISADRRPEPAAVLGLPEGLENQVTAAQAPGQLEQDATPVSASVVKFMKAVQKESGLKAIAGNYKGHEKWSPHFSETSIGKFSFDVSPPVGVDPQTGFYNRDDLLKFLAAVERAGQKTGIEWMAFYNDAAVVKQFNDSVNKGRIGFSGGGGGGTYHHGPQPYILHLHFNIMPNDLRDRFLIGIALQKAEKAFKAYLTRINALF